MEQREKLIELMLKCNKDNDLFDCFPDRPRYRQAAEILTDYLTANGVVVLPCRCVECENHTDEEPGMVYCTQIVGGWVSNNGFCSGANKGCVIYE